MNEKYMPNAFWTNWKLQGEDQSSITALKRISEERTVQITSSEESDDYKAIITEWGVERITKNTLQRCQKKEKEKSQRRLLDEQKKRSKDLEELFTYKLSVFQTDSIKKSTNRKIKSKIRKAKSLLEAQAIATILIGIEQGIIDEKPE